MNIKQQLYCKVTGWNGSFENPKFVKVTERFFELSNTADRVAYLMRIELMDGPRRRTATMDEAIAVAEAFLETDKRPIGSSLEAYKKLEDIP